MIVSVVEGSVVVFASSYTLGEFSSGPASERSSEISRARCRSAPAVSDPAVVSESSLKPGEGGLALIHRVVFLFGCRLLGGCFLGSSRFGCFRGSVNLKGFGLVAKAYAVALVHSDSLEAVAHLGQGEG